GESPSERRSTGKVLFAAVIGCGAFGVLVGGVAILTCVGLVGHSKERRDDATKPIAVVETPKGERPESPTDASKKEEKPKKEENPAQPLDLTVIFQHSPNESVAKLVRRGSPIPPGWEGGGGRILSIEIANREDQLSAVLAGGKEGQTATLTRT